MLLRSLALASLSLGWPSVADPISCARVLGDSTHSESIPWDVEEFDLSGDGGIVALVANMDGWSELHVLDARTGLEQPAPRLARGQISSLAFRPGSREFAFMWSSPGRRRASTPSTSPRAGRPSG
jgi:hypothetical protein